MTGPDSQKTLARAVSSNQDGLYRDLETVVKKYAATEFRRPVAEHTRIAFDAARQFVDRFYGNGISCAGIADKQTVMECCGGFSGEDCTGIAGTADMPLATEQCGKFSGADCADMTSATGICNGIFCAGTADMQTVMECCGGFPGEDCAGTADMLSAKEPMTHTVQDVILDSGCGTGESTMHLARKFPGIPVIGIDKSALRLSKKHGDTDGTPPNAFWIRAELLDFWKLALEEVQEGRWQVRYHAIYYPNPWPKQSEGTRRFHLHPIFPTLMQLSPITEVRTNWEIYAKEFAEAARILNQVQKVPGGRPPMEISCEAFFPENPETAFERKYKEAHQTLWRVLVQESAGNAQIG